MQEFIQCVLLAPLQCCFIYIPSYSKIPSSNPPILNNLEMQRCYRSSLIVSFLCLAPGLGSVCGHTAAVASWLVTQRTLSPTISMHKVHACCGVYLWLVHLPHVYPHVIIPPKLPDPTQLKHARKWTRPGADASCM